MARSPDLALSELIARQSNHFRISQAVALGVAATTVQYRIGTGRFERVPGTTGVLRLAGASPSPHEDVWAVVLDVGGDAVVARHTAAALHGLRPTPRSDVVHLLVSQRSYAEAAPERLVHRTPNLVTRWDVTEVDGLPCTSVDRTLCDLAREVPPTLLVALVNDAVRRDLTDVVSLGRMATRLGRFRWKRRLLQILDTLDPFATETSNATETRFLALCRENQFPLVGINHALRDVTGRQRYVDALFRRLDGRRVPVEVDGHETHWTRHDRWEDATRERDLLAAHPELTPFVRVPADEVWHAPDRVIARLRAALDVDCAADDGHPS